MLFYLALPWTVPWFDLHVGLMDGCTLTTQGRDCPCDPHERETVHVVCMKVGPSWGLTWWWDLPLHHSNILGAYMMKGPSVCWKWWWDILLDLHGGGTFRSSSITPRRLMGLLLSPLPPPRPLLSPFSHPSSIWTFQFSCGPISQLQGQKPVQMPHIKAEFSSKMPHSCPLLLALHDRGTFLQNLFSVANHKHIPVHVGPSRAELSAFECWLTPPTNSQHFKPKSVLPCEWATERGFTRPKSSYPLWKWQRPSFLKSRRFRSKTTVKLPSLELDKNVYFSPACVFTVNHQVNLFFCLFSLYYFSIYSTLD